MTALARSTKKELTRLRKGALIAKVIQKEEAIEKLTERIEELFNGLDVCTQKQLADRSAIDNANTIMASQKQQMVEMRNDMKREIEQIRQGYRNESDIINAIVLAYAKTKGICLLDMVNVARPTDEERFIDHLRTCTQNPAVARRQAGEALGDLRTSIMS